MITLNTHFTPSGVRNSTYKDVTQSQLRWDKADRVSYYYYTGDCLSPLLATVSNMLLTYKSGDNFGKDLLDQIEFVYSSVVSILVSAASMFVPEVKKGFFKYWWNEELSLLKEASIESNRIWTDAGKPRDGPLFHKRQTCRLQYRKCLRDSQKINSASYSNDLHEALLQKNTRSFWQCWRSKFELDKNVNRLTLYCTDLFSVVK